MVFLVIFLLIFFNALYVAAEFASISVRKTRIKQLAEENNALAKKLIKYIDDPAKLDQYISACQIGITVSSLVLGAYSQDKLSGSLAPLFKNLGNLSDIAANSASAVIILLLLTALQMILAELVPKAIALQYSTEVALYTVYPMQWSLMLFKWSIIFLNGTANKILGIFNIEAESHKHIHSPEEIDLIISESVSGGLIEADEHSRLHYALQLKMRTAKQILVPRIHLFAIDASTPVDEFLLIAAKSPYNHIPIYSEVIDNIIGIVHIKQMVKYFVEKGKINSIQEVIRSVLLIPESVTVDKIIELFKEEGAQQAIVIDEFGGTVGLVTLEDVLAEFMGEVGDEFKKDIAKVETIDDGRMRVPGLTRIDEIEFLTGIKLESRSDTIGGFVTELLGRLPDKGDCVSTKAIEVEVEKVDNRSITSVLVKKLVKDEDSDDE